MTEPLSQNEASAVRFFEVLSSGDLQLLKTFFTEDAVWTVIPVSIPGSGAHVGKVAICDEFLAPVRGMFNPGDPKLAVTNVFGKGTNVAVETHTTGGFPDGKKYDNRYCWILVFEGELVKAVREYMDGGYVSTLM